ncbi:MAG: hypothetical protein GY839_02350 [candidate division Zixibacteria bacterium]|nr:hypothetical protein [candidate division Zixibacteria bacterium]
MRKISTTLLLVIIVAITGNVRAQIVLDEVSSKQMAITKLSSMPLTFTENRGQWDEQALFKASIGGATFWFCADEIAYVFTRDTDQLIDDSWSDSDRREQPDMPDKFDHPRYKKESIVIRAKLIGANRDAEIIGEDRLSHNCNYFYGNEPSKWRTSVPNYSSITYKDIYPGIDLNYHGNGRVMKYDFIVHPGADISQIQIRYEGSDNLSITPSGDLEATTLFGPIHENIPLVYQEKGSSRREITGRYAIREPGMFGFEVDDYDSALTLVIDPELVYSTYLGGNGFDYSYSIAVDGNRCAYITGETYSSNFPTENPYQPDQSDDLDAFVTKLSTSGNSLVYSTYLGGSNRDRGYGIAVDDSGCAYVTGFTESTDFPTENPYHTNRDTVDAFVTKLSAAGDSLIYSTYLGGNDDDYGYGVAVDSWGCAYVIGHTASSNFPTLNPYQTDQGDDDLFITKLSALGNSLIYSTYLGGNNRERGDGIAVDGNGCAYVTGETRSGDFPTENAYQTDQADDDAFVTKFSASGSSLIYSTYLGGNGLDHGRSIAVDGSGCAYVTGLTKSSDFPTENSYQPSQGDINDAFVTKLSASGSSLDYSTYLGGNDGDHGWGIAVNSSGCAYVTGVTESTDFPTENPYQTDQGAKDAFVTKLSTSGSSLIYSTYLGGSDYDYGWAIAVDGSGRGYITGMVISTDFPTENPYQTDQVFYDAFVTKLVDILTSYNYLPGDANMPNGIWPPTVIGADVTYLVNYFRALNGSCLLDGFYASADANGDCLVIGSDVTKLVTYFRGLTSLGYCPDYEPAWSAPDDLPPDAPSGWPNCE